MSQAELPVLAQERPLRILLVNAGEPDTMSWSGLAQPLRLAAKILGPERLHVDVRSPDKFAGDSQRHWHLVLLAADEAQAGLKPANFRAVVERCRAAPFWG
ncbi:MAG TPA: ArgR family transcriptional regulator, partial [Massilia sp.]|nr:ArgR family transcriptional regulator [Massilia sp.]